MCADVVVDMMNVHVCHHVATCTGAMWQLVCTSLVRID